MATESRPQGPDVEKDNNGELAEELRQGPWDFEFFQAVRLLERMGEGQPVGRFASPEQEAVRFETNAALGFPPSQIHSLHWPEGEQPRMSVNFFGMVGPMGALPVPYSEFINERLRSRDHVFASFLNLFHHRLISLFYQAWEKYRFPVAFERDGDDRFTHYLLDLIGLGTEGLRKRQLIRDDSIVFYTGLIGLQPRSATALQQVLADYFGVPVEVEQFVGAWYPLTRSDQTRVGEDRRFAEQVSLGAVVGEEIWDQQCRARLVLGPLTLKQYLDFLPIGTAFAPLQELALFWSRREIDFEIQLILDRDETPPVLLDNGETEGPMLGWTTWIKNAPLGRDPNETILQLQ